MDNPTEPVIIEGRPFTPDDLHHLDELNEEIQKQNPPKPYQWAPRITPQSTRELIYARFFGRPIILDTPTQVTDAPAADAVTPSNQKNRLRHNRRRRCTRRRCRRPADRKKELINNQK